MFRLPRVVGNELCVSPWHFLFSITLRRKEVEEGGSNRCVIFHAATAREGVIFTFASPRPFASNARLPRWSGTDRRQRSGEKVDRDKIIIVVTKPWTIMREGRAAMKAATVYFCTVPLRFPLRHIHLAVTKGRVMSPRA